MADMVAVRDTQLYVTATGSGPELLFIHGMCGDADVWQGQVRLLADRFGCVSYDRRGHSRSPRGEAPDTVQTHADDAAALIRSLGLRPVVVGSSGGARVGVDLARRYGGLLTGAVLSEPPIPSLDPEGGDAFRTEVAAVVKPAMADGPAAAVDAFFEFLCPGLWSQLDEAGRDRYRANAPAMLGDLTAPDYRISRSDLAGIALPVLVVTGTTSHPCFQAVARTLADGLPDARLCRLAGSGHVTYAERPEEFAQAVAAFAHGVTRSSLPAG